MAFMTGLAGPTMHGNRRPIMLKDQHGRKWFTQLDTRSQEPVGNIEPAGWGAPFIPPNKYLFRNDPENPLYLHIDYDQIIADLQAAERQWVTLTQEAGIRMHGQAYDIEKPTPAVLNEVGQKPIPWQLALAAQQGNAYALGKTAEIDERLIPYLPAKPAGTMLDFSTPDLADEAPATPTPKRRSARLTEA